MPQRNLTNNLYIKCLITVILLGHIIYTYNALKENEKHQGQHLSPVTFGSVISFNVLFSWMALQNLIDSCERIYLNLNEIENLPSTTFRFLKEKLQWVFNNHPSVIAKELAMLLLTSTGDLDPVSLKKILEQPGFICPLTMQTYIDPVIAPTSGLTYERKTLEEYLRKYGYKCPLTGKILAPDRLIPNTTLKLLIAELPEFIKNQTLLRTKIKISLLAFLAIMAGIGVKFDRIEFIRIFYNEINNFKNFTAKEMNCPITWSRFLDPHVAADGYSYDKHDIEQHFMNTLMMQKISPRTNQPLTNTTLIPNTTLTQALKTIDKFIPPSLYREEIIPDNAVFNHRVN